MFENMFSLKPYIMGLFLKVFKTSLTSMIV